jgi:excisionase family DNA binding protein
MQQTVTGGAVFERLPDNHEARLAPTIPGLVSVRNSVLLATGGQAKLLELYRVLSAEEAAAMLGLALGTVRHMTARHELPSIKTGKRGVGYRVIDLIAWQEERMRPAAP